MRYLILSDIHANLHALDAVLADAELQGYDATLVLGDLVGYGADPAAVIARTLALEPVAMVRGNHDKVCAGLEPAALFNDVARHSIEWTAETLSAAELRLLAELPKGPCQLTADLEICHGAPFDEDYYVFDSGDAARAIEASQGRLCFFGHTHLPALFATPEDPVLQDPDLPTEELVLPRTGPALINVGSVGQPRDGDARAAYGILDATRSALRLRLRRVAYDVAGAQARIRGAGLPEWLAARLERGQ
ncbi:MAG TPA: metallophosphoesterase family protein [Vicinamibacterales bacterium]|nr:metallophosphoesterase family protein [Vicinamibacterales bacterium]